MILLQGDLGENEEKSKTFLHELTIPQLNRLAAELAQLEGADARLARALRSWCQHQTYPALRLLNEHEDRMDFYEKMNVQLKRAFRRARA